MSSECFSFILFIFVIVLFFKATKTLLIKKNEENEEEKKIITKRNFHFNFNKISFKSALKLSTLEMIFFPLWLFEC